MKQSEDLIYRTITEKNKGSFKSHHKKQNENYVETSYYLIASQIRPHYF